MFCVHKRNVSGRRFFYAPKTYIIIESYFLFSEFSVSQIYFELASISKNRSSKFWGFTVLVFVVFSDLESARGTIVPTLADMLCEACREAGDIDCIKRHCLPEGNASWEKSYV